MTGYLKNVGLISAIFVLLSVAGLGKAQAVDLVSMLTSQLGVTEQQAAGGAGSLFNFAETQMSPSDFGVVSGSLPDASSLMSAAPSGGGSSLLGSTGSSLLGGSTESLGGSSGGLGDIAGVASSFSDLGMSPDMASEFVPVILDYAQQAGSEQAMKLLQGAFSPF